MVIEDLEHNFASAVSVLSAAPDSLKHRAPSALVQGIEVHVDKLGLMISEMIYYHDQDMGTGYYE